MNILNYHKPFEGFLISFLGMKRFENIDEQLSGIKKDLEEEYQRKYKNLESKLNTIEQVRESVNTQVEKCVRQHISQTGNETIELITQAQNLATQQMEKLEENVLDFLSNYEWLINNKESLDKINASNISELREMFENALASEDKKDLHNAIAVVNHTIKENNLLGDVDDFFNLGSILAKNNYTKEAVGICKLGLTYYQNNIDIMSSLTLYSAEIGDFEGAELYSKRLNDVDRSKWNWRAYTFYIDYLNQLEATEDRKLFVLQCVADYKKYLPNEEKAYMAEFETYEKYGLHNEAIEALEYANANLKVTPQCSMTLAKLYLYSGNYNECIKVASKAIIGNALDQASAKTSAMFAFRALAKDAIILSKESDGIVVEQGEIISAIQDLKMAIQLGANLPNIQERLLILLHHIDDAVKTSDL